VLNWVIGPQTPAERNDFTRTILLLIVVLGLIVGLHLAWQALSVNRAAQEENAKASEERERITRYSQAVAQLGDDKREIRLGGIYALEQLAQESDKYYQQSIAMLGGYIRANAAWRPQQPAIRRADNQEAPPGGARARPRTRPPAGTTASTAAMQPTEEIQAAINVIRHRRHHYPENESFRIDLAQTDLRGADISGIHLEGADLHGANLSNANLAGAHLTGANLAGAYLMGTYMVKANLEGANLEGADLRGADLTVATLTDAHLKGAYLANANLEGASLVDADLEGASLVNADLEEAYLGMAHLGRAALQGAHLADAHLRGADLQNTTVDARALISVHGLTWEQIAAATICDGDRVIWQDGAGDREALRRLLPTDVVVPPAHVPDQPQTGDGQSGPA
jgi:uncharacterized protein YjbI with pentapeptide repeats